MICYWLEKKDIKCKKDYFKNTLEPLSFLQDFSFRGRYQREDEISIFSKFKDPNLASQFLVLNYSYINKQLIIKHEGILELFFVTEKEYKKEKKL